MQVLCFQVLARNVWAVFSTLASGCTKARLATCLLHNSELQFRLLGALEPLDLALRMNGSVAMVLPSRRESFGMVFIEALLSGCPVIYPKGAAIDGYFDDATFAIAVEARNPRLIADAMQHAVREQTTIKAALADAQASGALDRFSNDAIARDYGAAVRSGLVAPSPA